MELDPSWIFEVIFDSTKYFKYLKACNQHNYFNALEKRKSNEGNTELVLANHAFHYVDMN